jgi:hypothetical protein
MNPPRDEPDGGVSHDAWLREALRHAPDADALPPSALSETILRQARSAAAAPAALPVPTFGARIAAAWAWLGRPPVAAGFASVMVAGVVGLMWWDRPLEESMPPRDVAAAAPAQAPSAAPITTATPPAPSPPAAIAATPAPTTTEPVRATPRRAAAPAVARPRADDHAPAATTAPMSETTAAAGAAAGPAPRAAESVARADASPPAAPVPAEREARSAAAAADVRQAERNERARSMAALSKAAPTAQRRDTAAPITVLRGAVAAQPDRWRWRRETGEPRAVEPAFESWLGQLESATASRWQAEPADAAAGSRPEATDLQLWLDGRLHGTLRLDAGGVGYEPALAPAGRQRADLPAAAAAALRAALDQATR